MVLTPVYTLYVRSSIFRTKMDEEICIQCREVLEPGGAIVGNLGRTFSEIAPIVNAEIINHEVNIYLRNLT